VELQGTAVGGRLLRATGLAAFVWVAPAFGADPDITYSFSSLAVLIVAALIVLVLYGLIVQRLVAQLRLSRAKIARADARTEARNALAAEKQRLSMILRSIGEAVIVTDAHGDLQYLNPVAEKLIGWHGADAVGVPLAALFRVVHETSGETVDPVRQCVEQGDVVLASGVLRCLDGREFTVEHSGGPIRDESGKITGVVLSLRDVTEMRHLARQLTYQASHDALTGLINRREFELRLEHAISCSSR
jgi:PAS domain S-box-containing protein